MLRPERQFLQVGSEIIGTDSILADIEIIILAYKSLKNIGIKNITLELTSKIFLAEIAKCRILCANCHAVHTNGT